MSEGLTLERMREAYRAVSQLVPRDPLGGYRIVETVAPFVSCEQYRFPKSKKRRVRKKWRKRSANFRAKIDPSVIVVEQQGVMYMHPQTADRLRCLTREGSHE